MSKKGITNFEFVLALFVFLSTVSFVAITIINKVPNIHMDAVGDEIKTSSYYISQMLMFDEGLPVDWETLPDPENIQRFGFSSGNYYEIDTNKLAAFQALCLTETGRTKIIEELGYMIINISETDGTTRLYCDVGSPILDFNLQRHAFLPAPDNEVININIAAG
ncbi:hypothetical protein ACFLQN_00045 [Candidatus Aenigmatarchaeota archaeon]